MASKIIQKSKAFMVWSYFKTWGNIEWQNTDQKEAIKRKQLYRHESIYQTGHNWESSTSLIIVQYTNQRFMIILWADILDNDDVDD